ncbi:MAG TPA: hypothetical protein DCP51_08350 [Clostridiales bacterium]|nr:hypothetical protein [Clostridiales bacterium]
MNVSIYLSNENLVVVSGKAEKNSIKIKTFFTVPLPHGTLINGIIIKDELIRSYLIKLRSKGILPRKNIRLVIDRSSVLTKFMTIPNMKNKYIYNLIKETFSGAAEARNELVYDYSVIETGKVKNVGNQILACGMEKSLVKDYINLFKSAGISLSSIDIALSSVLKLQNCYNEYKNRTFILSIVDGENVFALLFLNGKYSFSNRFRLISNRGTPESFVEYGSFLSSIVQFNKTQKNNREIESVLFCGLRKDEEGLCGELTVALNIKVEEFIGSSVIKPVKVLRSKERDIMKNLFAVANLIE